MSDEQRKDDETEVEGHGYPPKYGADDETSKDEVEGHGYPPKYGADDEQGEEDEVEGHVHRRS
jgi:hypothetical protein